MIASLYWEVAVVDWLVAGDWDLVLVVVLMAYSLFGWGRKERGDAG